MTSSDVRDILSLPSSSTAPGPSALRPRPSASRAPKPEGISRELYALLGDNAPSLALAAQVQKKKFKAKPKFGEKKVKWEWKEFENQARSDGLKLKHWVRTTDEQREQYPFVKFNTASGAYSYSTEEYNSLLRDDDWSKEETDHLFDLCHTYDLRFVVIHDRWDFPGGKERSVEDLKARYYSICRKLIRTRISMDDPASRGALLSSYSFDKQREVERKKYLARLFTRSPAQIAEEEALYVEARRLEQQEKTFAQEREELLRLLGGWESLPPSASGQMSQAGAQAQAASADKSKKKRKLEDGSVEPGGGAGATSGAGQGSSRKAKEAAKQAAQDALHGITRFDPNASLASPRPTPPHLMGTPSTAPPVSNSTAAHASHGAYIRSARMLTPKAAVSARADQMLAELGVGPRLVFPTRSNVEKWENLLGAVTAALEIKKQLDRVESEIRVVKRLKEQQQQQQQQQQQ